MSKRIQSASENHFNNGLYCAESVVRAIAEQHDVDADLLTRTATAFCSGMSRTCSTCGAVTGAVLGMSAVLGRSDPHDSVDPSYQATNHLIEQFERKFGSSNCRELLGCDLGTEAGQATFREQGLRDLCQQYSSHAAQLAGKILESK